MDRNFKIVKTRYYYCEWNTLSILFKQCSSYRLIIDASFVNVLRPTFITNCFTCDFAGQTSKWTIKIYNVVKEC